MDIDNDGCDSISMEELKEIENLEKIFRLRPLPMCSRGVVAGPSMKKRGPQFEIIDVSSPATFGSKDQ
jgi:hypothetical protein